MKRDPKETLSSKLLWFASTSDSCALHVVGMMVETEVRVIFAVGFLSSAFDFTYHVCLHIFLNRGIIHDYVQNFLCNKFCVSTLECPLLLD